MATFSSNRRAGGKEHEENYQDVELAPLVTDHTEDSGTPSKPSVSVSATSLTAGASGKVLYACTLYSFCSVSMVLTNKSLASRYVLLGYVVVFAWSIFFPTNSKC
jgi:hypothetical protein